ncbi:MAG TPA: hypothetical protein VFQ02_11820 [Nitrospira sp.]|nr:hypothetical protein [Nitrospira sp.]
MKRLTYWESVLIGWRIFWQGIGGFVLALFLGSLAVVGLLPELPRTGPSYGALVFPIAIACVFSLFVMLPLVVRGLINASFGTFRLVVLRKEPCQSTI